LTIELLLAAGLGGIVGFSLSLLGIGGGVIIVPLLPAIATIGLRESVGTSLTAVTLIVLMNAMIYSRRGLVAWRFAVLLGVFSSMGSFWGARITSLIPVETLRWFAFTVMVVLVIRLFLMSPKKFPDQQRQPTASIWFLLALIGVLVGTLAGVVGFGTGIVLTPFLFSLAVLRNDQVAPTGNGILIFGSGFGALGYLLAEGGQGCPTCAGMVRWDLALMIFLGAATSSFFGRRLQGHVSPALRKWVLAIVLSFLATRLAMMTNL
jgi:uncharacterized membrane protein YfcA